MGKTAILLYIQQTLLLMRFVGIFFVYTVRDDVCFLVALMISALKAQGVPYSPAAIKQSLSNTAVPLGSHDPFSVGHGVIQVYMLCK